MFSRVFKGVTILWVFGFLQSSSVMAFDPEVFSDNLYRRLGLSANSSMLEIAEAAERLIGLYHHSMQHGGTNTAYLSIREAYEKLLDPVARRKYDERIGSKPTNPEIYEELPNWQNRVREFLNQYPNEMKGGLVGGDQGTFELDEGHTTPPASQIPKARSKTPDLSSSDHDTSSLWKQISRPDIINQTSLYRAYLNSLAEGLLKKKAAPREWNAWIESQMNFARARTFPGLIIGLPSVFAMGCFGWIAGGCLIGVDLWWKTQSQLKLRTVDRTLNSLLERNRGHHIKSTNPETARYTNFADSMIGFDLLYRQLWPLLSDPNGDLETYSKFYRTRYPWEKAMLRFVKRRDRISGDFNFSKALLLRASQDPNSTYLKWMIDDAHYWLPVISELIGDLDLHKHEKYPEHFSKLSALRNRLLENQKGIAGRTIRGAGRLMVDCPAYLAHLARTTRSLVKS